MSDAKRMPPREVKKLRVEMKMTQKELGEALGVQENTVWRWETDAGSHVFPPPPTALLIRMMHQARTNSQSSAAAAPSNTRKRGAK
jgi:DNA-binding transcriptional regulator YiaG